MITNQKIKLYSSLDDKKVRQTSGLFIIEGWKSIHDAILAGIKISDLLVTEKWLATNKQINFSYSTISPETLNRISQLKSPQGIIAIAEIPRQIFDPEKLTQGYSLFFDDIQDPGNFGTIIRTADWFGIKNIFCTHKSVDLFNPKVIQATMGSFARVQVHYTDVSDFFLLVRKNNIPVYGTFMEGIDIKKGITTKNGVIVFGNEGNGISAEIEKFIDKKICIPGFTSGNQKPESLNVSVAAAITCYILS